MKVGEKVASNHHVTKCRFERYIRLKLPCPKGLISIPLNTIRIEQKRKTLTANIKSGHAEPCLCHGCNPDTSIGAVDWEKENANYSK